jgi:hypothetical protein
VCNYSTKALKGKVAIGRARYLLNIVFQHLDVQIISFPLKHYKCNHTYYFKKKKYLLLFFRLNGKESDTYKKACMCKGYYRQVSSHQVEALGQCLSIAGPLFDL